MTLGVTSFKCFLTHRGELGREAGADEADDAVMEALFSRAAGLPNGVVCIHAKNAELVMHHQEPIKAAGKQDLASYSAARPPMAEAESINRAAFFSARSGCPLYVVHVSSAEGLDQVRRHKKLLPNMTSETCPHYLVLSVDSPLGTMGKVNPPLRTAADQEALWGGLLDGTIDTIGTDHIG